MKLTTKKSQGGLKPTEAGSYKITETDVIENVCTAKGLPSA